MRRVAAAAALLAGNAAAQCVMCQRTAQAQMAARAGVLNTGIFLLMVPTLALMAGFVLLAWKRRD